MTKDITSLMRKNIQDLKGYSCAKDEFSGKASIYMDANENPFPNMGMGSAEMNIAFNRYPDPSQKELREKLSAFRGVGIENVICGNGSDELIDQLIRIFCEPEQDSILICPPTFGMYSVSANLNNIEVESVPLQRKDEDYILDVESIIASKAKILFIPNPAAPTGGLFPRETLLEILEKFGGMVVVDEAYIDFASISNKRDVSSPPIQGELEGVVREDKKSFISELKNFSNLIVTQTFSKFWGLAGARVGMCFGNKKVIDRIIAIKMPYSLNMYSQALAVRALDNFMYWTSRAQMLIDERKKMEVYFAEKNFVKTIFRSDANFLYMEVRDAQKCITVCQKSGVVIRKFGEKFIRISVGLPEENQKVMSVLKQC